MFKDLDKRIHRLEAGKRNKENFLNILSITEDTIARHFCAEAVSASLVFEDMAFSTEEIGDLLPDLIMVSESEDQLARILSSIRALNGYDKEKDELGKLEVRAANKNFINLGTDMKQERIPDEVDEIDKYTGYRSR